MQYPAAWAEKVEPAFDSSATRRGDQHLAVETAGGAGSEKSYKARQNY